MQLNKIYNEDCLKGMKKIPNNFVDLIVTDPPYKFHSGGESDSSFLKKMRKTYIKDITDNFGHDFDPLPFLSQIHRIMKIVNLYVWTSKDNLPLYLNWAIEKKLSFNILTWHKRNPIPLKNGTYLPDTEFCVFMRARGAFFNSNLQPFNKYKKYFITNVGIIGEEHKINHPCPKPLITIKNPIEISSMPGDIILDPYLGSGTTAVACRILNRKYIGFEINQDYCKIAKERLQQTSIAAHLE